MFETLFLLTVFMLPKECRRFNEALLSVVCGSKKTRLLMKIIIRENG